MKLITAYFLIIAISSFSLLVWVADFPVFFSLFAIGTSAVTAFLWARMIKKNQLLEKLEKEPLLPKP